MAFSLSAVFPDLLQPARRGEPTVRLLPTLSTAVRCCRPRTTLPALLLIDELTRPPAFLLGPFMSEVPSFTTALRQNPPGNTFSLSSALLLLFLPALFSLISPAAAQLTTLLICLKNWLGVNWKLQIFRGHYSPSHLNNPNLSTLPQCVCMHCTIQIYSFPVQLLQTHPPESSDCTTPSLFKFFGGKQFLGGCTQKLGALGKACQTPRYLLGGRVFPSGSCTKNLLHFRDKFSA